ncbi:hypothetical protein RRG08_035564 [Elysia crispata]|uniref:Uncharacterized protein n=1 Tax=Elysia crispata TaxID=231223 RepID=A0AAE1B4S9_9GAST|nr:hypothetical protein RRG08_035564 [Elysia crispata]
MVRAGCFSIKPTIIDTPQAMKQFFKRSMVLVTNPYLVLWDDSFHSEKCTSLGAFHKLRYCRRTDFFWPVRPFCSVKELLVSRQKHSHVWRQKKAGSLGTQLQLPQDPVPTDDPTCLGQTRGGGLEIVLLEHVHGAGCWKWWVTDA